MSMISNGRPFRYLGALFVLSLAACAETGPTSPLTSSEGPQLTNSPSATLLECEATTGVSASRTIDLFGGTLRVTDAAGGVHEVVFPAYAVTLPTTFTIEVPASKYVEVRVTASNPLTGEPYGTINFPEDAQPTLAISYKRCTRSNVLNHNLALYHIDEVTDAILGGPWGTKTGSSTDPQVRGAVPHFTDYAVGMP